MRSGGSKPGAHRSDRSKPVPREPADPSPFHEIRWIQANRHEIGWIQANRRKIRRFQTTAAPPIPHQPCFFTGAQEGAVGRCAVGRLPLLVTGPRGYKPRIAIRSFYYK
ncbi:hypothetical protein BRADI_1g15571v3 [Brachypodium distachyon]|uniref:Uncharacterized protein n=1 Tax=Brachypodium distachyon TaxID=15368 RepID=A0A0Q3NBU9_BRADI|nr:hypothetical protein BRADI_1g15571v3 [Brachypodium distachyon]